MGDNTFNSGPTPNSVRAADGMVQAAPEGWILLPPGDAGLTRRVKAAGDHWVVQEKVGRRNFSRGVWASSATIERVRAELDVERSSEGHAKKQEAAALRRDGVQAEYVEDFHGAVLSSLAFHPAYADLAGHACRWRHGRPDEANPGRTAGGSRRDRLVAPPDHRLRRHGDPEGQGEAARGPPDARPAVAGVIAAVSSW